ncbi:TPA: restriction endonuclease [Vibrio vulnificus]|uniref:restriction endonuclease n=1 Tax=Vibrio vulnificus TaxID=672 RepID=UPI000DAB6664|nr:restriction endonuclease [Vibrio vulnificus]EJG1636281.1 restriction endonuclease [Vibrio parahaemolyticus]EGR0072692.1 restriction endonuclease [Vibrio vulnificus]EHK2775519.1 restriction endonuclease [Vibrio vulnificus]EIT7028544.1 restriction endonuclease [Vibrio vulnificus]EIZ1412053.1 restriction endonuclease [Vibrio vulnificus]
MTIVEAIKEVLSTLKKPLTYKEIYDEIISRNLYEFGAKVPEAIVNSKLRKHCFGLDFPSASPAKHFVIDSKNGKVTKYYLLDQQPTSKPQKQKEKSVQVSNDRLPEEKLYDAYLEHRAGVKNQLLEQILSSEPAFFERLVVDLLLAMGYGGDFPGAGLVSGSPGDGGIDGVIKEDKLGLDKIYIQAKRYTSNKIGRPDLQQFVGAMENVQKGVFITTSSFAKTAETYVEKQQKSIVLIDGDLLCDLMLTHGVGVTLVKSYATFRVDTDYFTDD